MPKSKIIIYCPLFLIKHNPRLFNYNFTKVGQRSRSGSRVRHDAKIKDNLLLSIIMNYYSPRLHNSIFKKVGQRSWASAHHDDKIKDNHLPSIIIDLIQP